MTRSTFRGVAPLIALAALAVAPPAHAQIGDLPILPLPGELPVPGGLPVELPGGGLPGGELPGGELPGGGLPGGLPDLLPGSGSGSVDGSGAGPAPGSGEGPTAPTGGPGSPAGVAAPVISGPSKAATVRVDARGRFRLTGVKVACPSACAVTVTVATARGGTTRFVKRTYAVKPGGSLQLKKLKVSEKSLRALRAMGVARVLATLKAYAGGAPVVRGIGLKLKPARR